MRNNPLEAPVIKQRGCNKCGKYGIPKIIRETDEKHGDKILIEICPFCEIPYDC
jgi:hypothetical protein